MDLKRPQSKHPIPKDARLAFKGKIFEIYQWDQELFDGTKAVFEKIKRHDGVNVFPVTDDGKIIVAEQEQPGYTPFWSSIGGGVEEDETPIDCARRELLEESGYEADTFVLWNAIQPSMMADWAVFTFIAKQCRKRSNPLLDPGEKIILHYLTLDEFIDLAHKDTFRDRDVALMLFRTLAEPGGYKKLEALFSPLL